jgi:hypothetical protein
MWDFLWVAESHEKTGRQSEFKGLFGFSRCSTSSTFIYVSIEVRSAPAAFRPRSLPIFSRIRMPSIHAHTVSIMMDMSASGCSYRGTRVAPLTSAPVRTDALGSLLGFDSGLDNFPSSEFGLKRISLPFRCWPLPKYITASFGPKSCEVRLIGKWAATAFAESFACRSDWRIIQK